MVILTLVYAITTIIICWFNYKTLCRQKDIAEDQKQISLFSIRNETYILIRNELHFWRFSNNGEVEFFFEFANKVDVSLHLGKRCQNLFDVLTQTHIVFGQEISKRLHEAWDIIRTEIYPCIKDVILELPNDATGADIIVAIKYKVQEDSIAQYMERLFLIEAEVSALIESRIKVFDL